MGICLDMDLVVLRKSQEHCRCRNGHLIQDSANRVIKIRQIKSDNYNMGLAKVLVVKE